jgi:hypothetical protein
VSTSAPSALTVLGNASFAGGTSTLSAGTMTIQGDFTQSGGATGFTASGTHRVVLNGGASQQVTFGSPGTSASSSHFAKLEIGNAGDGILFQSAVFVVDQLLSTPGRGTMSRVGSATGDSLWVAGMTADSIIFDNLPLRVAGTNPLGLVSDLTFENMNPAVNQWVITRAGQTFSPDAVTFSTAPNTGVYNLVVNNASGVSFVVTFTNSSPSDAIMLGPPPRFLITGAPLPILTWNSIVLSPP